MSMGQFFLFWLELSIHYDAFFTDDYYPCKKSFLKMQVFSDIKNLQCFGWGRVCQLYHWYGGIHPTQSQISPLNHLPKHRPRFQFCWITPTIIYNYISWFTVSSGAFSPFSFEYRGGGIFSLLLSAVLSAQRLNNVDYTPWKRLFSRRPDLVPPLLRIWRP